ncbi:ABC transporter permease [Bosea sp. NPDC055332]
MRPELILEALPALLAAVPLTLQLAVTATFAGFFLAVLIALARLSGNRLLSVLAYAYVYAIRGTPLLLQIFFIYFGLAQLDSIRQSSLWPLFRDEHFCALLALALNTGAYGSEIIRGGLQAVGKGQVEAAKSLGLSTWLRFRLVVFPQAVRQMLPAYGNELILMVKATSLASTVTIMEITGKARALASETYAPIEIFLAAGAIYLALNLILTSAVHALEARLASRGGFAMAG